MHNLEHLNRRKYKELASNLHIAKLLSCIITKINDNYLNNHSEDLYWVRSPVGLADFFFLCGGGGYKTRVRSRGGGDNYFHCQQTMWLFVGMRTLLMCLTVRLMNYLQLHLSDHLLSADESDEENWTDTSLCRLPDMMPTSTDTTPPFSLAL